VCWLGDFGLGNVSAFCSTNVELFTADRQKRLLRLRVKRLLSQFWYHKWTSGCFLCHQRLAIDVTHLRGFVCSKGRWVAYNWGMFVIPMWYCFILEDPVNGKTVIILLWPRYCSAWWLWVLSVLFVLHAWSHHLRSFQRAILCVCACDLGYLPWFIMTLATWNA